MKTGQSNVLLKKICVYSICAMRQGHNHKERIGVSRVVVGVLVQEW
jgi:hypothetical protein